MTRRRRRAHRPSYACWVLVCLLAPGAAADFWYVDDSAAPGGDGRSWASAFGDLHTALHVFAAGDVVRVGQGRYRPSSDGDRAASFVLPRDVALFGGYAGVGAADPDARDPRAWPTVLDGDLRGDDGPGFARRDDNSRHVVRCDTTVGGGTYLLVGVTIRGGHADALAYPGDVGGGLFADLFAAGEVVLRGCRLEDNHAAASGGAVHVGNGQLSVVASTLRGNRVAPARPLFLAQGGAMLGGAVRLEDSAFVDNHVAGWFNAAGGAVAASTVAAERVRWQGNTVTGLAVAGGAVVCWSAGSVLGDCVFVGNRVEGESAFGGAVDGSALTLAHCSFLGNTAAGTVAAAGGGVRARDTVAVGCLFSGNRALGASGAARGGALADPPAPGTTTLACCTFSLNHADGAGGALGLAHALALTNSVAFGNSAASGVADQAAQIALTGGAPALVTASCIEGWDGTLGGVGNHGLDPLFVDADGADDVPGSEDDDLRLLPGSPCIDAGSVADLPADVTDLDCDGDVAEPLPVDARRRVRRFDDSARPDTGLGDAPLPDMGLYEAGAPLPAEAWSDLGGGLAGAAGTPALVGSGCPCPAAGFELALHDAQPASLATLVLGLSAAGLPFQGGTLVPAPDVLVAGLPTGAGELTLPLAWPVDVAPGSTFVWQFWIADASGPAGFTASNGAFVQLP